MLEKQWKVDVTNERNIKALMSDVVALQNR